jgi:DNA ligase-1
MKTSVEQLVEIYEVINDLANTSSKNKKEEILASVKDKEDIIELFKQVLYLTYSSTVTFGFSLDTEKPTVMFLLNEFSIRDWLMNADKLSYRDNLKQFTISSFPSVYKDERVYEVIKRIIGRDLKAGVAVKTINKVYPNLIPTMEYMRCSLIKDMRDKDWNNFKFPAIVQEKMDGMFLNIDFDENQKAVFRSRGESYLFFDESIPSFKKFVDCVSLLPKDYRFMGELLVYRDGVPLPREESNGVMNSVISGNFDTELLQENDVVSFVCWDAVCKEELLSKKFETNYNTRWNFVKEVIGNLKSDYVRLVKSDLVSSLDEARDFALDIMKAGGEGAVLKNRNGLFKDGTSKDQIKIKQEVILDLLVKGFNEGTGKNESTFGSIICESSDGLLKVNVSSSGLTDKSKQNVSDNREQFIDTVIAVRANALMKPTENNPYYSLFLPVFVEFRKDKDEADSLQKIQTQFNSVK